MVTSVTLKPWQKTRSEGLTQKPDIRQHTYHLIQLKRMYSETLLTLLNEISPKLQLALPAAMTGHIVLSTVCDHVTSLQAALRQGWGP